MNQFLTSAVREIRTLRSVGAGVGDRPGHPVVPSNWYPYRDSRSFGLDSEQRVPSPKYFFQFVIQDLGPGLQKQVRPA